MALLIGIIIIGDLQLLRNLQSIFGQLLDYVDFGQWEDPFFTTGFADGLLET